MIADRLTHMTISIDIYAHNPEISSLSIQVGNHIGIDTQGWIIHLETMYLDW
jgi:hypothetical protein